VIASLVPLTASAVAVAVWIELPDQTRSNTAVVKEVPAQSTATPLEARREAPPASEAPPRASTPGPPSATARDRRDATPPRAKDAQEENSLVLTDQSKKAEALQKSDQPDALAAAPRAAAGQTAGVNETAARSQFRSSAVEIASPDQTHRWRIGPSGFLQGSVDGGATWEPSASGTTQDLLAGSAASATLCWVAGRGGTVLLSTDGRTWRQLPFPERVDLVAIQARDALSATVTTADRRAFRTADGGQTWTAVQEF
jgi:hypothetical protein